MIVISDTTPIISLMKANRLDLLRKLYGKVVIPNAVYKELPGYHACKQYQIGQEAM